MLNTFTTSTNHPVCKLTNNINSRFPRLLLLGRLKSGNRPASEGGRKSSDSKPIDANATKSSRSRVAFDLEQNIKQKNDSLERNVEHTRYLMDKRAKAVHIKTFVAFQRQLPINTVLRRDNSRLETISLEYVNIAFCVVTIINPISIGQISLKDARNESCV
jgi:hypothetical protein